MTIIFYDIPSKLPGIAWSPNTWKVRKINHCRHASTSQLTQINSGIYVDFYSTTNESPTKLSGSNTLTLSPSPSRTLSLQLKVLLYDTHPQRSMIHPRGSTSPNRLLLRSTLNLHTPLCLLYSQLVHWGCSERSRRHLIDSWLLMPN